ncbi:hypothetical protein [Halogeometricum sp. CBA1124]|uniref:hypothetical protein n=1 Tax=Halogeometricum sp. CBA1124 TaxID=2668071 RepID=UPI0018D2069C|nr:hypothetical protein [Halogeometricum sp. CBA1124]
MWTGDALMLLVGNGRRFPGERLQQANMEDGLLNVVVVKNRPALDYLTTGAADRLLRRGASHLTHLRVSHLEVDAGAARQVSLDGELVEARHLRADAARERCGSASRGIRPVAAGPDRRRVNCRASKTP